MNREEMANEIQRVETALNKTKSRKLSNDYTKYLRKLRRELAYYDANVRAYLNKREQMSRITENTL